jgi:hypothetical protein
MKKSLFFVAAAALALTACTSDNDVLQSETQQQSGPQGIVFDTYTTEATRAGDAGIQTNATLRTASKGFGVFAQYSNGSSTTDGAYSIASASPANFMWNEHVHYSDGWTYAPLKYWPNETNNDSQGDTHGGTDANGSAESDHADVLSFFAYAPYVAEVADTYTGKIQGPTYSDDPVIGNSNITANGGGIEAVISNSATGKDAWVRYAVAEKPSKSVDLLWGVAPTGGLNYTNVANGSTTITAGMPLKNLIKPTKDQKIKFLFQHALARIGLKVVAAINQISAGGALDAQTIIAVNSVSVEEVTSPKYLKMSGALNLNNTKAFTSLWSNLDGDFSVSVSNAASGELNPDIAYTTNATTTWGKHENHLLATNNPSYDTWTGVTTSEANVIADNKYWMVIPGNTDDADKNVDLNVTINYTVITKDAKLATTFSEVTNEITKKVTISKFTNNKAYNLKLILGLTSVKLDAEVADWQVDGDTEIYLPQNRE